MLFAAAVRKRFLCLRGCALLVQFHMLLVFTELQYSAGQHCSPMAVTHYAGYYENTVYGATEMRLVGAVNTYDNRKEIRSVCGCAVRTLHECWQQQSVIHCPHQLMTQPES
jgi:hypothetical protein